MQPDEDVIGGYSKFVWHHTWEIVYVSELRDPEQVPQDAADAVPDARIVPYRCHCAGG